MNQSNPHSFVNDHLPTRMELREYMNNVTSFDRRGSIKKSVILGKNGQPIPIEEFMNINAHVCATLGKRPAYGECLVQLNHDKIYKQKTSGERALLKALRKEVNYGLTAKGRNPKDFITIWNSENGVSIKALIVLK